MSAVRAVRLGPADPEAPAHARRRQGFTWQAARAELSGLSGGRGLDIDHVAVDRHCEIGRGQHPAVAHRPGRHRHSADP